jgi:hypothetical protein
MIEINWRPDDRQLRQFGLICLPGLPFVGWMCSASTGFMAALGGLGLVMAATAMSRPQWLKPVFLAAMLITLPIGLVVNEVILAICFFGLITPLAQIFRLMRRDALQRRLEPLAATYWEPHTQTTDANRYFRQF